MSPLDETLRGELKGRVCLVGLGNPDLGDDGLGVRLAEELERAGSIPVIVAGREPEDWLDRIAGGGFDHAVFLDAVDCGGESGSVVFLPASQLVARFPQISTHKLSLGTLARLLEARARIKVWLLGVKPDSLRPGSALSERVARTVGALKALLEDVLSARGAPLSKEEPCRP